PEGYMDTRRWEYLRVPFADYIALKLPPGTEHESDFVLLADIFPTVSFLAASSTRLSPPPTRAGTASNSPYVALSSCSLPHQP
ncbi:hypothetical protein C0993_004930, partial [Termitomyces sp. T159_Od127]